MKKVAVILSVLVLVLALSLGAFGQTGIKVKNIISTNPLGLVAQNVFNLSYERVLSPKLSIVLDPRFMFGEATGIGFIGAIRSYPAGRAPGGFFAGGSVFLASVSQGLVSGKGYGFGGDTGYKWIFQNGFTIEIGLGMKYISTTASYLWYTYTEAEMLATYLLALGYAF